LNPERPNIVLILADDMGYGDLACLNPQSKIPTPHLDALAAHGIRFTDAHASSSVCTPSRYSALTGRYGWRSRLKHGVLYGYSRPLIEPGRLTIASLLRQLGYDTACIGKWHLGWDWAVRNGARSLHDSDPSPNDECEVRPDAVDYSSPVTRGPLDAGFMYFFGISASLDMPPYCYVQNDRVTAPPDGFIARSEYNAFWREGPISPDFRHEEVLPTLTRKAAEYIRDPQRAGRRFFLYFPLTGPHTPIVPLPRFRSASRAGDYGDFCVQCDDSVGQILTALHETGLDRNTLVIFTSDNGAERIAYQRALETGHFSMGELRGLKRDTWEGGHRVPFLARWPGRIPGGAVSGRLLCLSDLLATVASAAGASLPADVGEDSFDAFPALIGDESRPHGRDSVVHHSCSGRFALRKDNWVFIDAPSGDDNGRAGEPEWFKRRRGYVPHPHPGELFDLSSDPSQACNAYADRPAKVDELRALLEEIRSGERSAPRYA
jgi:arylsulfatase A-like enzyme